MAGPEGSANAGQIVDLNPRRAMLLLRGGYAVAVKPEIETATAPARTTVTEQTSDTDATALRSEPDHDASA